MESNKLPHSIAGAIASWALTVLAWSMTHVGLLCGVLAGIASIYSIRASRETIKYRKKQQQALTSNPNTEPETET